MRAAAPLPLGAPGLGRRLTLVARRVASAGEQPSHAARAGHAVRHPGCGNCERERGFPVTCNQQSFFIRCSFLHVGKVSTRSRLSWKIRSTRLGMIVRSLKSRSIFLLLMRTFLRYRTVVFVYDGNEGERDRETRGPVSKLPLVHGDAGLRTRVIYATRQRRSRSSLLP